MNTALPLALSPGDSQHFFANLHLCTNKNALTHGIHPYPAKFIPQIPRHLISAHVPTGGVVLDPMCGSGTTLVEAICSGHDAIGIDSNPIATLISKAKTLSLASADHAALKKHAAACVATSSTLPADIAHVQLPTFHNRSKWFADSVAQELAYLVSAIAELSEVQACVARCALSAIIVRVSRQESETRWCAVDRHIPPGAVLKLYGARLTETLQRLALLNDVRQGNATVLRHDARALPIASDTVDAVMFSPPYANTHDYYLYNKLRMFWLGFDVTDTQAREIGSRNKHSDMKLGIDGYVDDMRVVVSESARVLRPRGRIAIVVADAIIRKELFDMDALYDAMLRDVGLTPVLKTSFAHRQFTSAFHKRFGSKIQKLTRVLVFEK